MSGDPSSRPRPDPDAQLAPRERAALERSVVRVGGRSRRALAVAALVGVAFLVGLARPWDWAAPGRPAPPPADREAPGLPAEGSLAPGPAQGTMGPAPGRAPGIGPGLPGGSTCAQPSGWRTATIQTWAGRRARVWTATRAVPATGPADPRIPFRRVVSDRVVALGWCAPVDGPERPPLAAVATLFLVGAGTPAEVPYRRLEPSAPDVLGELWGVPRGSRTPALLAAAWPPGRYVIRIATASGSYERYLGLEVLQPSAARREEVTPPAGASGPPGPGASSEPAAS